MSNCLKQRNLILLLFEIKDCHEFRNFSNPDNLIYITCANDLNSSLLQGATISKLKNYNLIRYYGNAKKLENDYKALIISTILGHGQQIPFENTYILYNESTVPFSIIENLITLGFTPNNFVNVK